MHLNQVCQHPLQDKKNGKRMADEEKNNRVETRPRSWDHKDEQTRLTESTAPARVLRVDLPMLWRRVLKMVAGHSIIDDQMELGERHTNNWNLGLSAGK